MLSKCCLAALAIVLSVAGHPARAMVCMDKSMTLDEVADTISAQKSCESAMKVFRDCELTASGDVNGFEEEVRGQPVEIEVKKVEPPKK